MATSQKKTYDATYYLKGALAGGICCSLTHGAMTPVDVVKTLMQLHPKKYDQGIIRAFGQVTDEFGYGRLATGFGATCVGYFVQGWFKFGGVEYFKITTAKTLGEEKAWQYRVPIYLGSAACAEFIADVFLCPLEATRIRLVSDNKFAPGLLSAFPKILQTDGVIKGFYSGFGPILFKQVPYTMAKFAVQGSAAEAISVAAGIDAATASDNTKMGVALTSGTIAGVAAAIISHPADTLLSLVNKSPEAGGTGSITSRLTSIAKQEGMKKLCTNGLGLRCVMIGALTAGQFAVFERVMNICGAEKFHFKNPNA